MESLVRSRLIYTGKIFFDDIFNLIALYLWIIFSLIWKYKIMYFKTRFLLLFLYIIFLKKNCMMYSQQKRAFTAVKVFRVGTGSDVLHSLAPHSFILSFSVTLNTLATNLLYVHKVNTIHFYNLYRFIFFFYQFNHTI